jgi:exosortase A-associated hydrolase 2
VRAPCTEAFFLEAGRGYRFCLLHRGGAATRGAVLFVHAFAEEMNKSRRMAALQAAALAQAGFDVLQIDLLGCGDSSGDFADATWQDWLEDVRTGAHALAARSRGPLWLWGHRTGCLLACEFARSSGRAARLVLWQPVTAGRTFVTQFLRMKMLAQGDGSGGPRPDTGSLRAALSRGQAVEVGGYVLSPGLFTGMEAATLAAPPPGSLVCWLDVVHADAGPPATSPPLLQAWSRQDVAVRHELVAGPPFWQTQEITECRPLLARTTEALLQ